MSKRVLTDDQMLHQMADAIENGLDLTELMSTEIEESNDEVAGEEDSPVETEDLGSEQSDKEDDAKDGDPDDTPPATEPAAEDKGDWRDKLPDDIKDKVLNDFEYLSSAVQKLDHYYRSNEGRVSGLQRKISELEAQKALLESSRSKPKTQAPAVVEDVEDDNEAMRELAEVDPALYKAIKADKKATVSRFEQRLNELSEALEAKVQARLQPIERDLEAEYVAREARLVEEQVPEVRQIVSSPSWATFINEAPDALRQLASSTNHREFLAALDSYTVWSVRNKSYPVGQPAAAPQPVAQAPSRLQETRDRKLAATTGSKPSVAQRPEQLDDDAYLEKMFQEIRKKEGRL